MRHTRTGAAGRTCRGSAPGGSRRANFGKCCRRRSPKPADSEIARQVQGGLAATDCLGLLAGSSGGPQTDRTGLADGGPQGFLQGLADARGSGGADQPASRPAAPRAARRGLNHSRLAVSGGRLAGSADCIGTARDQIAGQLGIGYDGPYRPRRRTAAPGGQYGHDPIGRHLTKRKSTAREFPAHRLPGTSALPARRRHRRRLPSCTRQARTGG